MQTGQPGSAPGPETSHSTPKELGLGYLPLHKLENRLHDEQIRARETELIQEDNAERIAYKNSRRRLHSENFRFLRAEIESHPDSHDYNPDSVYRQNLSNYYKGVSFSEEQKALIDRIVANSKGIDSYTWKSALNPSDIQIVTEIRDAIKFARPEYYQINPKDIEDFNRLFPQDRSEELFIKIKEIERDLAAERLLRKDVDRVALKREKKELTQLLIDDLKQHLVD